jgi:hypothetical protein
VVTSSAVAGACFLLLVGCEGQELGCRGFCENASGAGCTDTSVDECVAQCEEFEAAVPSECRSAWEALRDCAAEGEWTCEAETCIPSESEEPCGSEPVLLGCTTEAHAFEDCDGGDDCSEEGAAGSETIDGRLVRYRFSSTCDMCDAPVEGGVAGFPCDSASDCESHCCACGERSVSVQVCIDGACTGSEEACDDSLGACDGSY